MHRLTLLATLLVLACPVPGMGQDAQVSEAAPAESAPSTEEVEQLVRTLEDPHAREELIGQLKLMLEAQEETTAGALTPEGGIVNLATGILQDLWQKIRSIDPRRALIAGIATIGILLAAFLLRWLLIALLRRLYARLASAAAARDDEAEAGEGDPQRATDGAVDAEEKDQREAVEGSEAPTLPPTIPKLLTLVIGVIAIGLIAEVWGAGIGRLLATDLGSRIVESLIAIGIILFVTIVLWNVTEVVIERLLQVATRNLDRERTARRLDTLVPLLRSVVHAAIGVLAALLLLSELGVNIGPLLAGAGILGLAIGFGAQTLVKDLLTGVIILLEDGATVGDVVEVAGHSGVVEEMRIRILQLRDLSGNVHLVPYSEVTTIKNYTKDFSYALFEVGVAYREDTDEVCDVLREVGESMQEDADYGQDILEPLEILGVDQFADSAVIIKARMKTQPIRQWAIGREFNRRMKKRFDELGIEIPFPHTTVYFGEPKEGEPPALRIAREGSDGGSAGSGDGPAAETQNA
ncbi:MAG: mechanosensitive ion channel family protein [Gammaproteobacteria bacterium]